MKVSCRSPRLIVAALIAVTLFAGCPLPYDYAGRGAGSSHTTDPTSPTITASVTVAYSEQGGTSGVIPNNGSYTTGKTTTVTLSTTTENAIIYYTVDGSQITDFGTPKKITGSSGQLTVTRSTSVQTVDIHAVAIGPNMMPSQAVHATLTVSPFPILSVACNKTSINEDGGTATFTITASSSSTADITVKLLTGGTYTSADLTGLPASGASFSATLVHSTTTVSIPITGVHNPANANPTATLTLQPDPNTPPTYTVGLPASASVVIQNDASHTVTYNGNGNSGGAVPTDSNFYLPGATVTVLGNSGNLAKTGYAFVGWNTQANGSGTTYTQSQTFAMSAVNVILYAQWAPAYAVTYNGNGATGGTVPVDGTSYLQGQTVTVLGSGSLVKTEYIFGGWNTQANGGGSAYTQGQTFTMGVANVTLYAQWLPGIYTVAGNGTAGYSGDGGAATAAQLNYPGGVAVDASGNLYIAEVNGNRIRKVSGGTITTIAGNGTAGYSGDGGAATSALIYMPVGVAVDASGNLYFADCNNNRIRKISSGGIITTVAGNASQGYNGDNIAATSASLFLPLGVAVDASGNLYIADTDNHRVRKVSTGGIITTVAGNGTAGYSGDGGPATSAAINRPVAVTVDASGNLYFADCNNNRIRKISSGGIITTVAGNGSQSYNGDNIPATSAGLYYPDGVVVDTSGNLYIADCNNRIRKVSGGIITTFAGNGTAGYNGDNIPATSAEIYLPDGLAFDTSGDLYIGDAFNQRIRKVP